MTEVQISKKRIGLLVATMVMACFTVICMTKYCFSSAMVFIVDEGYMSNFQTGLISSAYWLVYAVFQFIGGVIADKWHPEKLIMIGLLSASVASGLIYFCYTNYVLTLVIWMLNAMLQFGVWPSVFRILSAIFKGKALSVAMMIAALGTPSAIMLSYLVAAITPRWQASFIIASVIIFTLAVAWFITVRLSGDYIESLHLTKNKRKDTLTVSDNGGDGAEMSTARLIVISGLGFILLLSFLRALIAYMPSLVPSILASAYDEVTPSTSTLVALIPLFCNLTGPIFSTYVSTKVKNEILAASIIFAVILPAGALTLLLGRVSYWAIIAAMAVVAFGASASTFFVVTIIATKYNRWGKGATIAGFLNAFGAFGNVAASAVMTWIADNYSWRGSLLAMVIFVSTALILAITEIPIWVKFNKKYNTEVV